MACALVLFCYALDAGPNNYGLYLKAWKPEEATVATAKQATIISPILELKSVCRRKFTPIVNKFCLEYYIFFSYLNTTPINIEVHLMNFNKKQELWP